MHYVIYIFLLICFQFVKKGKFVHFSCLGKNVIRISKSVLKTKASRSREIRYIPRDRSLGGQTAKC